MRTGRMLFIGSLVCRCRLVLGDPHQRKSWTDGRNAGQRPGTRHRRRRPLAGLAASAGRALSFAGAGFFAGMDFIPSCRTYTLPIGRKAPVHMAKNWRCCLRSDARRTGRAKIRCHAGIGLANGGESSITWQAANLHSCRIVCRSHGNRNFVRRTADYSENRSRDGQN